ncbi:LicD family protein [Parabacteroides johnsonii]|uniref:LicD family protein n=1 Tax=Parabacteroides johnsonii TaxID=387661 RepID=UPI003AB32C9A
MDQKKSVRDVQDKILEVMKFIDSVCRTNGIVYYIMGGTALGAIRHGGFIPWDDDLDIFMTPQEYKKFKVAMEKEANPKFMLQEWRTVEKYLEYAKVRKNGTTFIEDSFKDRKDLHQGIYVDIMILHKVPESNFIQKLVYYESKFVTLYALSQRNWKPKSKGQAMVLNLLKLLPCQLIAKMCYRRIYKYDDRKVNFKYCYWITPAKFRSGLFDKSFFESPVDIPFEDTVLYGSKHIKEYLEYRYGNYMKLPSEEQQRAAVHAMIFDTENDYTEYIV